MIPVRTFPPGPPDYRCFDCGVYAVHDRMTLARRGVRVEVVCLDRHACAERSHARATDRALGGLHPGDLLPPHDVCTPLSPV